jgi:hypothetical protein
MMGVYIVLAALGAIGGWIVYPSGDFNCRKVVHSNLKIAVVVDLLFALTIANLDRFVSF